jgi:hypothetical protein
VLLAGDAEKEEKEALGKVAIEKKNVSEDIRVRKLEKICEGMIG